MTNNELIPGQRWISDSEPELGLGVITQSDIRTVSLHYPASEESRVYAREGAPLTRVRFSPHDSIEDVKGIKIKVKKVKETDGLLVYSGEDENGEYHHIKEGYLNHAMKLNKPRDRLFNLQLDKNSAYELRYITLNRLHTLLPSPIRGLAGARVSLIPHQLFIAQELASRTAPRVLLADEVGLGKTIEAGLILHQQLLNGRARRVLIMLPETLQHQWLVEMLRRFNLRFSIFNEQRCESLQHDNENPFHSEQLVLCTQKFLQDSPLRREQILAGNWDTLVVDEAHHLQWQVGNPSPEYELVEALSRVTPGVLLLTATPEQLGAEGHFARLRLLDPDRFFSLEEFLAEESLYAPIAHAVEDLQERGYLNEANQQALKIALADNPHSLNLIKQLEAADADQREEAAETLISLLRDRHGTGRILFRNTRNTIKGFPERELQAFPLAVETEEYLPTILQATRDAKPHADTARFALTPERIYQEYKKDNQADWVDLDPRVDWLYQMIKSLRGKKVLVICASATTVLELEATLRQRHGMHAAVFHEAMSIIERDRAAAWFADMEEGVQTLLCSEIGSEGRNFQFSHHLIMFDLPLNPDLLEQRIGRLDRIGQTHAIQILVPYLEGSAQAIMLDWYHQGIDAFTRTCPAGQSVYQQVETELLHLLLQPENSERAKQALLQQTQPLFRTVSLRLKQGRDRLLELNSFRASKAHQIVSLLEKQDQDSGCADYMQLVFDTYGVDYEQHDFKSFVARPNDHMLIPHFPELPDEGMTLTYSREHALVHEDQHFMSWEHPMVSGVMDLILSSEQGNAALAICKHPKLKTGDILLETLFRIEASAPRQLQINRFLPPQLIRLLVDSQLKDRSEIIPINELEALTVELDAYTLRQIIDSQQDNLRQLIQHAEAQAAEQLPLILDRHTTRMQKQLGDEIQRLQELQRVNPNVRDEEINFLETQRDQLAEHIQQTGLRLDALRLIIGA
ncbi:RNA polymerase associated protein RapA [hydrothermal vent metagenome]|uniref:RNA polymerase associated protein RapA n=1 Tax=hydrothermal vent metagenome TaxID=652676 RepID=A0A3B1C0P2_9ZZZZ